MGEKRPRLVVTFYTTAGAIATEQLCRRLGLEGRLISVPRRITSDCGMAWAAPKAERPRFEGQPGFPEFAGLYEVLL